MKRKNRLTLHLGSIIMVILLFCIVVNSFAMYRASYKEVEKSAGIELYGCANITTGLLNPNEIVGIKNGDQALVEKVGKQLNWTIDHKHIFDGQYILDLDGKVLAVDDHLASQGLASGDQAYFDEELVAELLENKEPVYSSVYEFNGKKRLSGYAPIFADHDETKEIIAISAIDFDASILTERTWTMVKGSILFTLIPILLAGIVSIFFIKRATDPLSKIIRQANEAAAGNLAIEDVVIDRNDEIGQLSKDLNQLIHNLRSVLSEVVSSSAEVATASEQLAQGTDEIAKAAEQNTEGIHSVRAASSQQLDFIQNTNETISHIAVNTSHLTKEAQYLNEESTQTLMKSDHGSKSVEVAMDQMNFINQKVNQLTNSMEQLTNKSEEITDILYVITNISKQTNLLALNAAIEASRAGEHGKGFAVVANEIRNLAEQSDESVKQIATLIKEIQANTTEVATITEENASAVKTGTETLKNAGTAFGEIKIAITGVANHITDMNGEVKQIDSSLHEISGMMTNIEQEAGENNASTERIVEQLEEQTASIEEITALMTSMAKMSEKLQELVNKFKI